MQRVVVTGAAGFIGSTVTDRLLARGLEVVGVDDFDPYYDPALKERNLRGANADPRFALLRGSVADDAVLDRAFACRPDAIIHLAAKAGVRPSMAEPLAYEHSNVHALVKLLERARAHAIERVVFASSSSVYGLRDQLPLREDDDTDAQVSVYGATKKMGELLCNVYSASYRMVIPCLRFFTVYGPRQRPDMAISKFAHAIAAGEPVLQYGDGSSLRDYTFVDDAAAAVLAAAEAPLAGAPKLNIGSGRTIPLSELIALIARAVGEPARIDVRPTQLGDPPATHADVSRARALIGYTPRVSLEDGIARYVAWMRGA